MAEARQHISEVCYTSVLSNLVLLANRFISDILIKVPHLRIFLLFKNLIFSYFLMPCYEEKLENMIQLQTKS